MAPGRALAGEQTLHLPFAEVVGREELTPHLVESLQPGRQLRAGLAAMVGGDEEVIGTDLPAALERRVTPGVVGRGDPAPAERTLSGFVTGEIRGVDPAEARVPLLPAARHSPAVLGEPASFDLLITGAGRHPGRACILKRGQDLVLVVRPERRIIKTGSLGQAIVLVARRLHLRGAFVQRRQMIQEIALDPAKIRCGRGCGWLRRRPFCRRSGDRRTGAHQQQRRHTEQNPKLFHHFSSD